MKTKLPEVHLKHALFLEDEERFKEAEEEFIKAGKPREAIDMYIHQQDWSSCTRVSEQYDPPAMPDILVAQATVALERKDYQHAEALYINAKKPEQLLKAYQDANMWDDAIRICKRHLPNKFSEVQKAYNEAMSDPTRGASGGGAATGNSRELLNQARMYEDTRDFSRAVDAYLKLGRDQIQNDDQLEEVWEKAVNICSQHVKDRYVATVKQVSTMLQVSLLTMCITLVYTSYPET
jgi:intraflagellar transport protein 172